MYLLYALFNVKHNIWTLAYLLLYGSSINTPPQERTNAQWRLFKSKNILCRNALQGKMKVSRVKREQTRGFVYGVYMMVPYL